MADHLPAFLSKSHVLKDANRILLFDPKSDVSLKDDDSLSINLNSTICDSNLNLAQKERIAEAILQGRYIAPIKKPLSDLLLLQIQSRAHAEANRNRHTFHPRILCVQSGSVPLQPPSLKDKRVEIERCKKIGHGIEEYRWGPKVIPTVPLHVPRSQSAEAFQHTEGNITRATAISESRKNLLRRSVEQVKGLRTTVQEYNAQYTETRKRQIRYQRNVLAFRQKLLDRLLERNDPQTTDIMRSLTDDVIHSFIERFKGCSMSVDAVLSHIGSTLPISSAPQHIHDLYQVHPPQSKDVLIKDLTQPIQFNDYRPQIYADDMTDMDSSLDRSLSSEDLSRFRVIERKASPKLKKLKDKTILKRNKLPSPNTTLPNKVWSSRDPVLSVCPREVTSRGAGFRSPNSKGRRSPSPVKSEDEGRALSRAVSPSGYRPDRAFSPQTAFAVDSIKQQLEMSGNLQSSQPERILTDDELLALATKDKPFDSIADSLSLNSISPRALPPSHHLSSKKKKMYPRRELGQVSIGSRKPPIALKTAVQYVADSSPDLTPAPIPKKEERRGKGSRPKSPVLFRPLSKTSYGNLYVVSSYKEPIDPAYIENL